MLRTLGGVVAGLALAAAVGAVLLSEPRCVVIPVAR